MENKKLTGKEYWEGMYQQNFRLLNAISNGRLFQSYYHFAFRNILTRFIKVQRHQSVIEIGCAPGNYLIKFYRFFGLTPFGVEYAPKGFQETIQNFQRNGLPEKNIILADFFDERFQKENTEKYDIVFSAGFIEHFSDPLDVLKKQIQLIRPGGLLICLIPNVKYVNEWLSSKELVALHNQSIMSEKAMRELCIQIPGTTLLYNNYFGGIFNFGLLNIENSLGRKIVFLLFIVQRFTLDMVEKAWFILSRKDCISQYSSPSLLCIIEKK